MAMPQLDAYLVFDGNCADAMRFYERTLGGKLEALMTHAESPMAAQASPGNADRIMHSRLVIDGRSLMASDSMAGQPYEGMKGFSLTLIYPTAGDAQRVFDALAQGGRVTMPLQKTFWAKAFGMLVDRFGTLWMINGEMASM
jgi:PhnB protein